MSRKNRKNQVLPVVPETSVPERKVALKLLRSDANAFDPETYIFDDSFKPGNPDVFGSVHTIPELMACLDKNEHVEAEGIFVEADTKGNYRYRRIKDKKALKEAWKKNARQKKMREADSFAMDGVGSGNQNAGLVGDDYVPILGGPYNKQPYLYDYLKAHAYCFHEYHHNPFGRAIVHITRDFVLGRGVRIDCDDPKAKALWEAFCQVNNFPQLLKDFVKEGSIYGENFIWWVPDNKVFISYNVPDCQEPATGLFPRIRMIDPSTVWEVITFPEDIKRVLAYQLVFPTQYQIYNATSGGAPVPSAKFIMQQLPATDVMHFKYNCVSNEKRGRSDLFPVLGYLKWLRDCINYRLIALKKQSAWTEDISVDGNQSDVDAITAALDAAGPFEPAGSRFVHTKAIVRDYLNPEVGSGGTNDTVSDGIDMVSVGSQIPSSYWGLIKGAGGTRAGALVGTEPVAKKFENRQDETAAFINAVWRKFQDEYGVKGSQCKVTFAEIITQDRSAKLKDIKFSEDCGYISRRRAAEMVANELSVDDYDYDAEKADIDTENPQPIMPTLTNPLTAPSLSPPGGGAPPAKPSAIPTGPEKPSAQPSSSAVTSGERRSISQAAKK